MRRSILIFSAALNFTLGCTDEKATFAASRRVQAAQAAETSAADANPGTDPSSQAAVAIDPNTSAIKTAEIAKSDDAVIATAVANNDAVASNDAVTTVTIASNDDVQTAKDAVAATKVGVNFEDSPGANGDFNDAVTCFVGNFAVSTSEIVSLSDQNITASMFSEAGFNNTLVFEILRGGSVVWTKEIEPKQVHDLALGFKIADRLRVSIKIQGMGDPHPMTDANYSIFKADVCNDR